MNEGFRNGGAGVEDAAMKEFDGAGDLNPPVVRISIFILGFSLPHLELTLPSLLWFELRKWRFRIRWSLSLPFPVHGAFVAALLALDISEHNWRWD